MLYSFRHFTPFTPYVTYIVSIVNAGTTAVTGLTLTITGLNVPANGNDQSGQRNFDRYRNDLMV